MNTELFLQRIKKEVVQEDKDASIILFGSRARGDHKEDSDWDILVVTSKEGDRNLEEKISDKIYALELEYLQPVSSIIFNKGEWLKQSITPFYKNVITEGYEL
jgi:uncharacterized protein